MSEFGKMQFSDREILIRIDERMGVVERSLSDMNKKLENNYVEKRECYPFQELLKETQKNFVRIEEFQPIKKIVYGVVGTILMSVLVGLLSLSQNS